MAKTEAPTAWVGWVYFAASMLVLIGAMQIIQGLGAIFNPDFFVKTSEQLLVFNLTTWGWIDLIVGILAVSSGIGLFAGKTWARITALIFTVLVLISSLAFITIFPFWAMFTLLVGGLVIYAITVHGDEVNQ